MSKARPATPTVAFIDDYCARYRDLFHNVRHFEPFTALHLGLLAETRRKSLPRLGKTVHADPQALHHFLAHAEWSVEALRQRRLDLLRHAIGQTPFLLCILCILCIDETGDRKKGHTTDYVASQYIGNLHTLATGIVSVNAYGVLGSTTFPLLFRVFKPETRLTAGDGDKTKPQLAIELIRAQRGVAALGFPLQCRLGRQSLRRERPVHQRAAPSTLAVGRGHPLPSRRLAAAGSAHPAHPPLGPSTASSLTAPASSASSARPSSARAGPCAPIRSPPTRETLPPETTWDLMTNQPGKIERTVGNTFGLRTQDPSTGLSMRKMIWGGPITASLTMHPASAGGSWS